jgi:FkbM family methyltransferase
MAERRALAACRRALLPPLTGRRGERPVAAALLAPEVRPALRFMLGELAHMPRTTDYRLRASQWSIRLRHRSADLVTFAEVFGRRDYEFPFPVLDELRRRAPVTVVDLGANAGFFSVFALQELGMVERLVAYEPDPAHLAVLRRCAEMNGGGARWEIYGALAATRDEGRRFVSGQGPSSHAAAADEQGGAEMPARDAFPDLLAADLIKMDIEGGEWEILSDARLKDSRAAALVLEYHPHLAPGPDTRAAAYDLLAAAGFAVRPIYHGADGHGMAWGVRQ